MYAQMEKLILFQIQGIINVLLSWTGILQPLNENNAFIIASQTNQNNIAATSVLCYLCHYLHGEVELTCRP